VKVGSELAGEKRSWKEKREMENEACVCESVKLSQKPNTQTEYNTDLDVEMQVEPW